jgi:hypothetical protein
MHIRAVIAYDYAYFAEINILLQSDAVEQRLDDIVRLLILRYQYL